MTLNTYIKSGFFNNLLSLIDRSSRKIPNRNNETDSMNQMDLTYLQNISTKHKRIYLLLCNSRILLENYHIICYKSGLNKYKKIEITTFVLSDCHVLKLGFNNNRNNRKTTQLWKFDDSLFNDLWIMEAITPEIKG